MFLHTSSNEAELRHYAMKYNNIGPVDDTEAVVLHTGPWRHGISKANGVTKGNGISDAQPLVLKFRLEMASNITSTSRVKTLVIWMKSCQMMAIFLLVYFAVVNPSQAWWSL